MQQLPKHQFRPRTSHSTRAHTTHVIRVLYLTCGGTRIPVTCSWRIPWTWDLVAPVTVVISVEKFALHYSVPLGDDGVGHHLENVCVLVL